MKPTQRPLRRLLALALAAAATPAFAQSSPFSQTIFFGDSLTDSGHFRPTLVQLNPGAAVAGRFTTNPGFVWSEFLAQYYGTGAVSANQGGTNYAVGGARTGTNGSQSFGPITVPVPALTTQLASYLTATGGKADARALYTVWGGPNDLFAAVANPSQTPAIIGAAVTSQITVVAGLKQAGAEYILVPNIPDLGRTPGFLNSAGATQLAATYNAALYNGLTAQGLRVIPLDTFNFLREITASPAQYGFANVTTPACTGSSLTCTPLNYVTPGAAGTYAFADSVHPSLAAHQMLGQYAISVLEGPRQLAVLPYTASVIGRSRADRVASHIDTKPEADGVRWWGDLRGDSLRYDEGDFDGITPTGTFGLDWTRGDFVFGGFAGFGRGQDGFRQHPYQLQAVGHHPGRLRRLVPGSRVGQRPDQLHVAVLRRGSRNPVRSRHPSPQRLAGRQQPDRGDQRRLRFRTRQAAPRPGRQRGRPARQANTTRKTTAAPPH